MLDKIREIGIRVEIKKIDSWMSSVDLIDSVKNILNRFKEIIMKKNTIIIIGGGELAVEIAQAFRELHKRVVFIVAGNDTTPATAIAMSDKIILDSVAIDKNEWCIYQIKSYSLMNVVKPCEDLMERDDIHLIMLEDAFLIS